MNRDLELLLLTFDEEPSQSRHTLTETAEVLAALEKHLPELMRDIVINEITVPQAVDLLSGNYLAAVAELRRIAWKRSLPVLDELWATAKADESAELARKYSYLCPPSDQEIEQIADRRREAKS